MAKSEVDYMLKCTYSDIVFGEWENETRSQDMIVTKPKRYGEIVQSGLRVRFVEFKVSNPNEFDVHALFPDMRMQFESPEELEEGIGSRLLDFCSGIGGREWQRVK